MHSADKAQALKLLGEGLSPTVVARKLGLSRGKVRHLQLRTQPPASPTEERDTLPIEYRGARPLTLPELIAYYKIDESEWEVQSWKANVWEQGTVGPDGLVLQRPLHQTSATFKRRRNTSALLIKRTLEDIKRQRPPRAKAMKTSLRPSPYVLEVCLFDLHLAKLAWGEETGETYDLPIAVERARAAVHDLVERARKMTGHPPRLTILPLGNDYFHYDHITGLTTAGTPQDRDSRYAKMFRTGRRLASEIITLCASHKCGVRVPIIPGNHDRLSCFTMGEVLDAEFSQHGMVNIDNTPKLRKYVEIGQVLLGYTHGSDEKVKSLPQLMATEQREAWGRTRKHEWHIGHLHKRGTMETVSVNEELGCVTRYISSLSGTDAWHYAKGYVGNAPAAEAFVWDTAKGRLVAHLVSEC